MKTLLTLAAAAIALSTLVGCSGDDETEAEDTASQGTGTTTPTDLPTTGSYPAFEPEDYTYVLEQVCYCPVTGPVRVTVEDGQVAAAVLVKGAPGLKKGSNAPEYLHATINDVIDRANDPKADEVSVRWPEGQDYPSRVAVDQIENAVDDEVTYIVRNVQIG